MKIELMEVSFEMETTGRGGRLCLVVNPRLL